MIASLKRMPRATLRAFIRRKAIILIFPECGRPRPAVELCREKIASVAPLARRKSHFYLFKKEIFRQAAANVSAAEYQRRQTKKLFYLRQPEDNFAIFFIHLVQPPVHPT